MVAALVGHLQKQGVYTANDIAVLTPYLGQLRHLKEKLQNSFGIILNDRDIDELAQEDATKDVEPALAADSSRRRISMTKGTLLQAIRLATVDNFQGEEAKVVIISLVRSNDSNNCGFLRTPNRINVLLSRAKHGMYILGNSATASSVPMWQRILEIFRTEGNIGTVLELSCPRHPDTAMQVTEPEDFSRVAPEAGCDLMTAFDRERAALILAREPAEMNARPSALLLFNVTSPYLADITLLGCRAGRTKTRPDIYAESPLSVKFLVAGTTSSLLVISLSMIQDIAARSGAYRRWNAVIIVNQRALNAARGIMKARVIQSITPSALIGAAGALLAAFTRARSSVILANPTRLALLTARCAAFILRAKSSATSLVRLV
ncbi:uncharacterized protein RHO25_013160 [Cercospora beticola]|uniref:DNA2/NAM7 helicase-like C-terminal domain-containing protein n=1 Tax=Cercospora beticola TaxID=122368 RepID=A0ABZ0PAJ5_CERBT|nr:hypothetical protein RHO25_013160 [Cercospora beticola]